MRSLSRLLSAASAPARSALAAPPALAVPRLLPLAGLDPGVRRAVAAVLVTAAALLAFHVRTYAFLCDDAFISFRYARNFAHGHGLVFNPGFERVEGYSNFLWVVVLAGLDRLGLEPPRASLLLSWASTLLLWGLVVAFAARWAPRRGAAWAVVVPALFLAANRSFAVWASSGLETRAFELCVVAGTLTLADELDDALAGSPLRLRCAWWFALGALTRPDGVLFGACALGAAALLLARRRALDLRRYAGGVLPFALLVGAHFAFRRLYYGAWLPNTYYAKVGGRTWWDAGLQYLAAFAVEYAVWLWAPLVVLGGVAFARAHRAHVPALFAAVIVPHALFVTSIGGDHFEYRPLDLYLPLLFLLAGRGAVVLASPEDPELAAAPEAARSSSRAARAHEVAAAGGARRGGLRRFGIAGYVALSLWMAFELPWQSHVQFPARYLPGFPGALTAEPERVPYLDPALDPLGRLPGLRVLAAAHRALLRSLSRRFIGLREEEHARFLATVVPEGKRLHQLVEQGLLGADAYIATGAVGAIPYFSGLRTLDRLGLTDARVAHSQPQAVRAMAHDRSASFEDARARGVDLWAADAVHFLWRIGAPHAIELAARGVAFYAADVGPGEDLLVMLPRGLERTAARFPRLHFQLGESDEFLVRWFDRGTLALRDSLRRRDDDGVRRDLAYLLMMRGRAADALAEYTRVLARTPDDPGQLLDASECQEELGRHAEARAGLERALALATMRGDEALSRRIQLRLQTIGTP